MRLLLCFCVLFSIACSRQDTHASSPPDIPTVAVAKVTTEDLSHNLVLTAEFKPYQEIDVMAKVAGYVREINVDAGDRVKQGQLLATLEVPEMNDDLIRSDANVVRAQTDVTRAKDELQRAESAHQLVHFTAARCGGLNNPIASRSTQSC